ncbi:MAG: hypothetical protein BGO78_01090 [Chloroflexi bacterium 44-23]|nr:MAG: hypothetical protein BGO78_01090 [Chloroflexi bacterium 44-23]
MNIFYLQLKLHLQNANSLKEKRGVLKSMVKRTGQKFNISIVEADFQDVWKSSLVSLVWLSQNNKLGQQQLEEIRKFISIEYPQLELEEEVLEIL